MKKLLILCITMIMVCLFCACGMEAEQESTISLYADVIARLEAGDYDGARSLIDIMEGKQISVETESTELPEAESAMQTDITAPVLQTEAATPPDYEVVELTQYNVRDYFTFEEEFYIADKSGCTQYITLKEEYSERLISVEDVKVEVSYLLCDAHGIIDLDAEEFQSEYFDVLSQDREEQIVQLDNNAMGWITQMLYFSKRGCFPDFAMDVELESASGKLIFTAE